MKTFLVVQQEWSQPTIHSDKAKILTAKLKFLKKTLRDWQQNLSSLAKTIENNKLVLSFLDTLEEFRDLSLEEWNFRQVVKSNLEHLLEKQRIYWMQRGRIKWATLGDENTKFFHINKISTMVLKDRNGIEKNNHDHKAQLLWEAFKERLGTSEFTHMHFDVNTLLGPSIGLQDLILPFQKEEIDSIVSNIPNGKSPGPDGFNTKLLKKC
jgi:hypothetical protein